MRVGFGVRLQFYVDPETSEPHIYRHEVDEVEVAEVLAAYGLRWHEGEGKWIVVGKTGDGRFLQVIYLVEDGSRETTFVITAYPPKKELIAAYRRRMRKKGKR